MAVDDNYYLCTIWPQWRIKFFLDSFAKNVVKICKRNLRSYWLISTLRYAYHSWGSRVRSMPHYLVYSYHWVFLWCHYGCMYTYSVLLKGSADEILLLNENCTALIFIAVFICKKSALLCIVLSFCFIQ